MDPNEALDALVQREYRGGAGERAESGCDDFVPPKISSFLIDMNAVLQKRISLDSTKCMLDNP